MNHYPVTPSTIVARITMAFAVVVGVSAPVAARTIELADLAHIARIGSPRVAPDGKSVVVVVGRPDYDENRFESRLVLIDVASGNQRNLTSDRPAVRQPRWSPSGTQLAFIAKAEIDGKSLPQIFVLPLRGGEAQRVTQAPRGVALFEWAGNDDTFVYTAAAAAAEPLEGPERHNKSFVVTHHDYLATAPPPALHVWRSAADGGEPQRVNGDDVVAAGGILLSLAIAPDGSAVAFTGYPADRPGDILASALYVLDLETGARRSFGDTLDVVAWGGFSPDSSKLAYSRPDAGGRWFNAHHVFVATAGGDTGGGRKITGSIDRTFYGGVWMPDGRSMLVGGYDAARIAVWEQPLDGKPRKLDLGPLNAVSGISAPDLHVSGAGGIAFVATEPHRPAEVYWLDSVRARPRRLTDFNAATAELDLGRVEKITWDGPDDFAGFTENGILIYPPDFDPAKRYPLVLKIHGGPMGATTESFDVQGQLLAARGWLVFGPNYRGSANLGGRYQSAVIHDAGVGPGRDVMAGLAALQKRGFVDAERIGVSGWSYGGYMTSWLIGNYPDVWRAALAGAPVTDYFDQYTLSDINTGFGWGFDTQPWSPAGQVAWREQSPIAHVHRATTPTLILCDTGDLRVPITESYKLYHALDDKGVPVEFVAYPVTGHFPGDPVHVRDIYRRWGDWMERWFDEP